MGYRTGIVNELNLNKLAVRIRHDLEDMENGIVTDKDVKYDFYVQIREYNIIGSNEVLRYGSKKAKMYTLKFANLNIVDKIYTDMVSAFKAGSLANQDIITAIKQINEHRYYIKK